MGVLSVDHSICVGWSAHARNLRWVLLVVARLRLLLVIAMLLWRRRLLPISCANTRGSLAGTLQWAMGRATRTLLVLRRVALLRVLRRVARLARVHSAAARLPRRGAKVIKKV